LTTKEGAKKNVGASRGHGLRVDPELGVFGGETSFREARRPGQKRAGPWVRALRFVDRDEEELGGR
jgi:hypothetical protein